MAGKIIDPLGVHNVASDVLSGNFASDKAQPIDYLAIGPFASSKTGRAVGRAGAIAYGLGAAVGALGAGGASAGAGAGTAAPTAIAGGGGATAGGTAAGTGMTFGTLAGYAKTAATILSPVVSIMSAASGINSAKAMAKLANPPTVQSPVTMPILGAGQTQQSMLDEAAVQAARRGRAATILTAPSSERLGS